MVDFIDRIDEKWFPENQSDSARRNRREHLYPAIAITASLALGLGAGATADAVQNRLDDYRIIDVTNCDTLETVVVAPGDNLWRIATEFGQESAPRNRQDYIYEIKEFNGLESPDLHVGQKIKIPNLDTCE